MAQDTEPSGAQTLFGDFAPMLVDFTDDVLFGQVRTRPELSPKERSLVTVAALTTSGNTDQLVYHSAAGYRAMDERRAIKVLLRP
jgi:4-carboxymuconolactone decarboxylase